MLSVKLSASFLSSLEPSLMSLLLSSLSLEFSFDLSLEPSLTALSQGPLFSAYHLEGVNYYCESIISRTLGGGDLWTNNILTPEYFAATSRNSAETENT